MELVSLVKLKIDIKDGITLDTDRIPFNQHIFSSYIASIIPKYVDRCTIKILWRAGVMTSTVPLSFYEQLLPLPKPYLLLPLPRSSPFPPIKILVVD